MKRLVDIILATIGIVVMLPLLAAVSGLILLLDGRPVLFRQTRVGFRNERFTILKFRTMRLESEGPALTVGNDNRVTRLGSTLRCRKIDELPQLLNVLRGDMSFVGWRPEIPEYVSRVDPLFDELFSFPPGITDPASIKYRSEAALLGQMADPEAYYLNVLLPQKVSMSLAYARRAGIVSDFRVILKTLR
jgi:lipopolysaccharide/colanic/teichoic acid biosynthesis glycosyltransferase